MSNLLRPLAAGLVLILMSVAPAPAQSPDAVAAAKNLMEVMKAADNVKAMMPALMRALKPAIAQNRPEVERELDALAPYLLEEMNSRLDEILNQIAAIYARNFTVAELKELAAFYASPTGQKVVQRLPSVTQESMVVGQQWGQAVGAELQRRMRDELRKKGHDN